MKPQECACDSNCAPRTGCRSEPRSCYEWTDTTPKWTKPNPFRRYEANAGGEQLQVERNEGDGRWFWTVRVYDLACEVPGGDLPDADAKHIGPIHLTNQVRVLLSRLEAA